MRCLHDRVYSSFMSKLVVAAPSAAAAAAAFDSLQLYIDVCCACHNKRHVLQTGRSRSCLLAMHQHGPDMADNGSSVHCKGGRKSRCRAQLLCTASHQA